MRLPGRALAALLFAALLGACGGAAETAAPPWRAAAASRAARLLADEAPPADASVCAAAWRLPYQRAAQLPAGYPRQALTPDDALRLELFLFHQVDPPLTLTAARSLVGDGGGLVLNVTVLDNSGRRELSSGADAATRKALAALGPRLRVHAPLVPMDFQQSHNAAQELAYAAGADAFFVMHSDAAVQPGGAALLPSLARELVRVAWRPPGAPAPVGVVFFSYDALALFNPAATLRAGVWDVNFGLGYGADVDYYHRLKLAGFAASNSDDAASVGNAASALARRVNVTHEGSHSLKSVAFACTRALRMEHTFEAEWRGRYLRRKWGEHWNGSAPFAGAG